MRVRANVLISVHQFLSEVELKILCVLCILNALDAQHNYALEFASCSK